VKKIQDLPSPAVLLIQDPLVGMLYLAVYPSSSVVVTNKTPGGTKYSTAETLGRGADDKLFFYVSRRECLNHLAMLQATHIETLTDFALSPKKDIFT